MVRWTGVQFQNDLKNGTCLILSIIRYGSRVRRAFQGKQQYRPLHFGVVTIEKEPSGYPRLWSTNTPTHTHTHTHSYIYIHTYTHTHIYIYIYIYIYTSQSVRNHLCKKSLNKCNATKFITKFRWVYIYIYICTNRLNTLISLHSISVDDNIPLHLIVKSNALLLLPNSSVYYSLPLSLSSPSLFPPLSVSLFAYPPADSLALMADVVGTSARYQIHLKGRYLPCYHYQHLASRHSFVKILSASFLKSQTDYLTGKTFSIWSIDHTFSYVAF